MIGGAGKLHLQPKKQTKGKGMVFFDQPEIRFDEGHFFDESNPVAPTTGEPMALFRIGLGFMRYEDPHLDDFASNVAAKLTTNAALFPNLPASVVNLTAAQGAFHTSLSIGKGAGTAATADKKAKRLILLGLLRQNALYIQGIPNLTAANAALSGYEVIEASSHGPVNVETPVILGITNVASGKLGVKAKAPKGYKSLEFFVTVGTAAPVRAGTFPSTRDIVLEDLTPGTLYAVQVRAVFGSKRYSELSDPVSHRCT